MGTGNTNSSLSRLITIVLVMISSKKGELKKRSKFSNPTHGLRQMPRDRRKFLNAMVSPYIGR